MYDLADAAAAVAADPTASTIKRAGGWLEPLADALESILYTLQRGLDTAHVPYSYGFSIILLTLIVKLVTFPLTKQQVESALAVQALKPRIDLIKARYEDDKDKISKETNMLYEQAGVNPLAGCLPSIATIPVFIGLYSSLSNVANEGSLAGQGFLWIPSLAGPTSMDARGITWLYPLVDGAPPIGWHDALLYLSLPVLLVVSQWVSSAIISPPVDPNDPNAKTTKALVAFLPLMIGWFSLNVPAGLSLYYLANSVLTSLIQVYLRKLGGANVIMNDLGPVTKPGSGRRLGEPVTSFTLWEPTTVVLNPKEAEENAEAEAEAAAAASRSSALAAAAGGDVVQVVDPAKVSRRVKRKKLSAIGQQMPA